MGRSLLVLCSLAAIGGCGPRASYVTDVEYDEEMKRQCLDEDAAYACMEMGDAYSRADPAVAIWYWARACNQGEVTGCGRAGSASEQRGELEAALGYFDQGCEIGYAGPCDEARRLRGLEPYYTVGPDSASVPTGVATDPGCDTCSTFCANPTCSGVDCYIAGACACQCAIDRGGCGYAPAALQECVEQNEKAAVGLYNAADYAAEHAGTYGEYDGDESTGSDPTPVSDQPADEHSPPASDPGVRACVDRTNCLDARYSFPEGEGHCDGEVVGSFRNGCDVEIQCQVCPTDGYNAVAECHVITVSDYETVGGEMGGQWWCGIKGKFDRWGYRCAAPDEPFSCLEL